MSGLSIDWILGGADGEPALGLPDGSTLSYRELRALVAASTEPPPGTQTLIAALRAWNAGDAVLARGGALAATTGSRAALVIFTSGSSGQPKGVLLSAQGIRANVEAILSYLPVRTVRDTALVLPLHYSYALVGQALTTLRAGGTLWLFDRLEYPAQKLAAMARVGRPLGLSSVPTSLRLLARTELEVRSGVKLGYLASAGGRLERPVVELVRQAFGQVRFFNQYGLTEASPRVSALSDDEPAFAYGSVGRALPGLQVFAVSPSGARLPPGASGELAVRGPSVMLGYLDDPDGTARVLAADGTLRTGDIGYVDASGYVFVEGRSDGLVKVAGERVSLEQVAAALREVSGARDVQVVALKDDALGARLVAIFEGGADEAALKARARAMPAQQRPSRYVRVDVMPKTQNGKVDRPALLALAERGS